MAEERSFPVLLNEYVPQIQAALPKDMDAKRLARAALTAYNGNAKIAECEIISIFASVIQCAQTGLELGFLGHAFLIPYKKRCQFVAGWKGLVDLVNRAGMAQTWTGAVYDGDQFDYEFGDRPYIKHRPGKNEGIAEALICTYAVGRPKGAEYPNLEVWSVEKIERHLKKWNKVGDDHYALKGDRANWEMYARKVPLLQVLKYLRSSPELARAVLMNDMGEVGKQRFRNIQDAYEGVLIADNGDDDAPAPAGSSSTMPTASKPEKAQEYYSAEAFDKNKAKWQKGIAEGKLSIENLTKMLPATTPLSEAQLAELTKAAKKPVEAPPANAGPQAPLQQREPGSDDQ